MLARTIHEPRNESVQVARSLPQGPRKKRGTTPEPRHEFLVGRMLLVDPQNPKEVVDVIEEAVSSDAPFVRVPVGKDASALIERRTEDGDAQFVTWLNQMFHE